ncbi:hypothetical protein [Pseudocolwellia agarivorans]|uniref:hypothetical protein n=1 Tax=Pseudocolwellia agarivorans TaxID=1911682 RepID=UPI0009843ECE|nr:hypothetical protein [Pseudocolwellia agarivorans]
MSHSSNMLPMMIGVLALVSAPIMATQFEVTPYIGIMSSSDLTVPETNASISVDTATHFGIAVAWQESPNGQGQVLVNYASHDFVLGDDNQTSSVDVVYAHFNGIALFKQQSYITTVSIGLGAARFSGDGGSEIAPSFTAAIGTRYEISKEAAIVTELRAYASLMQDGDTLFCQTDICAAEYNDTTWIDTSISVGFSYKF